MTCSKCRAENAAGAKFCIECGESFKGRCPKCGLANPANAKFCQECGTSFGPAAEPKKTFSDETAGIRVSARQPSGEIPDGERKTVTALFADIKGSMELMEDLDPEEARAIVDPALKLMIDAAHRYDGYIVQSTGDGVFALFGAPVAHEDHPQRALYAALRMQEELRRYSDRIRSEGRLPIQVRVGANTGEVVVRSIKTDEAHAEYTPIGHSISLAARMQALAPIGSIASTELVRKLCEGSFIFKSLGPTKVKGVTEPVNVYEVTGFGPLRTRLQRSAGRGLTKFVGRQCEMDAMKHASDLAKSSHGQIVAAMAEAGVGKSRLFYEFKVTTQSGWLVLEAFSFSHGKASAYLPVIDLLHGYFEIDSDDDARRRREKVAGKIVILDRALEDTLPCLYSLLAISEGDDALAGLDAQARRRRTHEAIKRLLLRESLNQPLMLIFEDLHWIDEETQALLNLLAETIGTARVLMLVNYRPEYSHQWGSKTYYTQLRLDPLGRESAEQMLGALLGENPELAPLRQLIIDKTEGNPFFMEEMVQALFEEGALVRNGAVHLAKPLAELKIPPTVQGILASRIDRLSAPEKDLLQTVAVIGLEFPLGLARKVTSRPDLELQSLLASLQLAEFIYEQPAVADVEYTFKHALTQEVAYSSLLMERRRGLHRRVAEAVESLHADRLDDHYAELAHHFDRSGDADNATRYLHLAGQQASSRCAFREASGYAARGLELVGSLSESPSRTERELGLQVVLGAALYWVKGPTSEDWAAAVMRVRELSLATGRKEEALSALAGLGLSHMFRGELPRAVEMGRQAVAMGQETKLLGLAHAALGRTLLHMGEFRESIESLERALSLPESQSFGLHGFHAGSQAFLLILLCNALWFRGFPDQAMLRSREALQLARKSRSSYMLYLVLIFAGDFFVHCGREDRLRECLEALAAVAPELEAVVIPPQLIEIRKGWLLAERGELQEGIGAICNGISGLLAKGCKYHDSFHRALLALAYLRANQVDSAFGSLDDAVCLVEQSGERYYEAELHRLRGELLLADGRAGDEEVIQGCFRKAIEVARKMDAKSWELRATTSLARLLDKQGRRDEARTMLAEIYGWFTEGFDTADLKNAKALLDELSG